MGHHLVECRGPTNDIEWRILDACRSVEKLMIIEAIYISKLKPALNTRDEYYKDCLKAIVYFPRNGAPNIFGFLKQTSIVTLHVITDLVSKRKQKDQNLIKEYFHLHQKHHLELNHLH